MVSGHSRGWDAVHELLMLLLLLLLMLHGQHGIMTVGELIVLDRVTMLLLIRLK
jgi:hypothetical protein